MMTSVERMTTVFQGNLPDRVPFFPTIYTDHACHACGHSFEETLINPALSNDMMLGAARRYETDVVRLVFGPGDAWREQKEVRTENEKLVQFDRASGRAEGTFDVQGGGVFCPYEMPEPIQTVGQANDIPVPSAAEWEQEGRMHDVKRCVSEAREHGLFTVGLCGGQTLNFMVAKLGSSEAALLCFYDDPALALAVIAKGVALSVEKGKAYIAAGVDAVYIGDSYASGSVISPDIYERFCAPAYKELAQELHRLGAFVYKHCCGNYNPLLEGLAEVGVDAMDGIDPTSGMSVAHTKRVIGDRLTLMGGISCMNLLNGTPESVYEEAAQCIAEGKPGGRYVLGSACAVPRCAPPENLDAAKQAILDHGEYSERH